MVGTNDDLAQWERWNAATTSIAAGFETRPSGPLGRFRGMIRRHHVLGLDYSSLETNARATCRGPDTLTRPDRHHCLVLQQRGRSMVRQGRRTLVLNPNDMALLAPSDDCEIVNHGLIRQLAFFIPETCLIAQLGTDDLPGAVSIPAASPLGTIIAGLLRQIHGRSASLTAYRTPTLGSALAGLISPLLAEARGEECQEDPHPLVNALTIMSYIDANLHEEALSPRRIAHAHGCSLRHMHRLFAASGTTVGAYIKERRLNAVAEALRDPGNAWESITAISLSWGFSEFTHFSRSFRARFGVSPRAFRDCGAGRPN